MPLTRFILALGLLCAACLPAEAKDASVLDKFRALNGDWEGTFTWTGARTDSGKISAQYFTTGNGSAIVENLISEGKPVMTSVYHMDGSDLRVTHFCGAQNQPRLRAGTVSPDADQINFAFVDVTNLASPNAGHVHGLQLRFLDSDHINIRFHFKAGEKESDELIDLKRRKS